MARTDTVPLVISEASAKRRFRVVPGSLLVVVATTFAGCVSLKPLPSVPALGCTATVSTTSELWKCLDAVERHDTPESGFRSTMRVVQGDLGRKRRDQRPGEACTGETPPGFELIAEETPAGSAPPLRALYKRPETGQPTIIVVHGLFDSKYSRYVEVASQSLVRAGMGVLIPDMRWHGCLLSNEWLPTLGIEEGHDLLYWANWLRSTGRATSVGLLGFSLGGTDVLAAAASVEAREALTAGAMVLCPPGDLQDTLGSLDIPPFFADQGYSKWIKTAFHAALVERARALSVPAAVTLTYRDFLDWLAASTLASTGVELVSLADPARGLQCVAIPVLIVTSSTDPIIPESSAGRLRAAAGGNENIHVVETRFGGHLGLLGLSPEWFASVMRGFFEGAAALAVK